jgi:hypothetical protein
MGLPNLDLDAGIILTPLPDGLFGFAELLQVAVMRTVLTDFKTAVDFEERSRQFGMPVEE